MLTAQRFHRTKVRDSGNLVTSLVQAGNKPARYYATMRASELGPLFTSAYSHCTGYSRTGSEQKSAPIHTLTGLQGPVFLINSRTPLVTATRNLHFWHPLYLRYRAILPNSLDSITPIRLGLFSQGHPSRFSVRFLEILFGTFSLTLGLNLTLRLFLSFVLFSP